MLNRNKPMLKTGVIYAAVNKTTGMMYIGQTVRDLKIRKGEHISRSKKVVLDKKGKIKKPVKFHQALIDWDETHWDWIILKSDIPIRDLTAYEIYFIVLHNSYHNGYNSNWGINRLSRN